METPDEIWAGDLFERRQESEDLIGYLESIAARPAIREDGHAHVLAVDAPYGEGKTYFLRRFARHMAAAEHPVAFVDAWVDDLEDEPLVALAATLQRAMEPYTTKHPSVEERVAEFTRKAGRVAKIAGIGFGKRVLALAVTQGAVGAMGEELTSGSGGVATANKDAAKDTGKGLVSDVEGALAIATPSMEARIAKFREGQDAILAMKASLSAIVDSLAELGIKTPITIVIDELDRCRPTYAIKLLEEVKHLFDVSGVAFVLGLHAGQLTSSVKAAYGAEFEAQSYLRRFFNRRYSLRPAELEKLVGVLMKELAIPENRMAYPGVILPNASGIVNITGAGLIARVMEGYGLNARDAFPLIEMLQTAMALSRPHNLQMTYLLPLLIQQIRQSNSLANVKPLSFKVAFSADHFGRRTDEVEFGQLALNIDSAIKMTTNELMDAFNKEGASWAVRIAAESAFNNVPASSGANIRNYRRLIESVKRFTTEVAS